MGSPQQLTKSQVKTLKDTNAGAPFIETEIEVKSDKLFNYQLSMRENDVYFINLVKL